MNLYDLFQATAQCQPDRPAFLGPGIDDYVTYAAADRAIVEQATRLHSAGVQPGMCIGLHCPSGVDYVVATYAAWRCGASVLPIPVELTRPEKEQILHTIALDFVISPVAKSAFLAPYTSGEDIDLQPGAKVFRVRRLCERPASFSNINAAFVRFTSGTTASAKGVVLSHETVHERIRAANEVLQVGPEDRVVWLLSMAYHFAVTIVAYLSFGAAIILPRNHFAGAVLEAARRYRGTLIYGSPTHFTWLASAAEDVSLTSMRLAVSTTAPLDGPTAEKFHCRYGLPLVQALGIIEVGLPFINVRFANDRPEAVGELLPAYELQLKDAGIGDDACEILLRGPGILDAYYEPWQPRAAIMRDGWFHTGDVATVDADGCVMLRGRSKDVISVLGMKFFPQEVEAVLAAHPAVESACVWRRLDERMGEAPEARVMLRANCTRPSEEELIAFCERQLALFKVPRRIEFVESLPQTPSGKLLRRTAMPGVPAEM